MQANLFFKMLCADAIGYMALFEMSFVKTRHNATPDCPLEQQQDLSQNALLIDCILTSTLPFNLPGKIAAASASEQVVQLGKYSLPLGTAWSLQPSPCRHRPSRLLDSQLQWHL